MIGTDVILQRSIPQTRPFHSVGCRELIELNTQQLISFSSYLRLPSLLRKQVELPKASQQSNEEEAAEASGSERLARIHPAESSAAVRLEHGVCEGTRSEAAEAYNLQILARMGPAFQARALEHGVCAGTAEAETHYWNGCT